MSALGGARHSSGAHRVLNAKASPLKTKRLREAEPFEDQLNQGANFLDLFALADYSAIPC
jgi:hypothetical protein